VTSLFELPERGSAMPVDLLAAGSGGVSLLEFFSLEDEDAERLQSESAATHAERSAADATNERTRQTRAMVDAARNEALAQARTDFEEELSERVAHEHSRVERVCAEFAMDRQRYFAAAEAQVVKLAIAMASRVLAREVAADPMHLAGTVRAALARVHDGSVTVLRVPTGQVTQWTAMFANACDGSVSVLGDERLGEGECVLETDVGRVELGVQVQLAEIERGFGELLRRQGE
jgi:flagellar assembly protein FliH